MSSSVKLCPTRFFRGAKNFLGGDFPPLVTGLGNTDSDIQYDDAGQKTSQLIPFCLTTTNNATEI